MARQTPAPLRPHYQLIRIGSAPGPKLSNLQARWILEIATNPYWIQYASRLWYVAFGIGHTPIAVVYIDPPVSGDVAYQVIGAPCGTLLTLSEAVDAQSFPAGGGGYPECTRDPLSPDHKEGPIIPLNRALTPTPVSVIRMLQKLSGPDRLLNPP